MGAVDPPPDVPRSGPLDVPPSGAVGEPPMAPVDEPPMVEGVDGVVDRPAPPIDVLLCELPPPDGVLPSVPGLAPVTEPPVL